jgi:hypothetical protein
MEVLPLSGIVGCRAYRPSTARLGMPKEHTLVKMNMIGW